MISVCVCVGEIESTEAEDTWLETHAESVSLPRMPRKLYETFPILWKEYGSENLAIYESSDNSHAYYRHNTTLLSYNFITTLLSIASIF